MSRVFERPPLEHSPLDRSSCIFPSFCAAFLPAISQRAANKATLQIVSSYNLQTTNRLLGGGGLYYRCGCGCGCDADVRVEAQFLFALRQLLCCFCGWRWGWSGLVWSGLTLLLVFSNKNQKQSTDSRVFLGRVLPGQPHSQYDAKYKSA